MIYKLLADFIVILHFLFIVFVIIGGFFVLKWPKLAIIHIPAALWGAYIEFTGGICPLTPMENWLRSLAGQFMYQGDYIERYLMPIIYPVYLTRDIQFFFGAIVLLINGIAYSWLILKWYRCK